MSKSAPPIPPAEHTCATCRHSVVIGRRECHRNPPFADNTWPAVTPDDTCGEWKAGL